MAAIYVLDVPEFRDIIDHAQARDDLRVSDVGQGYYRIETDGDLRFNRRELGFKPAIWYSVFSGGVKGRFATFDRTDVVIVDDAETVA